MGVGAFCREYGSTLISHLSSLKLERCQYEFLEFGTYPLSIISKASPAVRRAIPSSSAYDDDVEKYTDILWIRIAITVS